MREFTLIVTDTNGAAPVQAQHSSLADALRDAGSRHNACTVTVFGHFYPGSSSTLLAQRNAGSDQPVSLTYAGLQLL